MAREDILAYLTNLRKPEVSDPLHRWIGSYNEQRQRLAKFFKWLYSPEMEVGKRPTPTLIENIGGGHCWDLGKEIKGLTLYLPCKQR